MTVVNNLKWIILTIILVLILFVGRYFIPIYHKLKFEKTEEFEIDNQLENELYWFTLRDSSYNGFFDISYLDQFGVNYKSITYDFKNYTYIITINHELKKISYSYSKMKNRNNLLLPKQFIGKVELGKHQTGKIHIYQIKKMDIDCNYHKRDENVILK